MSEERTEVGLVKWYGGYNRSNGTKNKFGFIERYKPNEEIFVHENNLITSPENLKQEVIVLFESRTNEEKGKPEAINVRLAKLNEEKDLWLCINSDDRRIWEKALDQLLKNTNTVNVKLAKVIESKLDSIEHELAKEKVKMLPWQALCTYRKLRNHLTIEEQIEYFSHYYQESDQASELLKELVNEYRQKTDTSSISEDIWEKIPSQLISDSDRTLWSVLPDKKKYQVLINQLDDTKVKWNTEEQLTLFLKLQQTIKSGTSHETLPENIKRKHAIFRVLNDIEQVRVAWSMLPSYWNAMKQNAKIMAIFRAVKENNIESIKQTAEKESDLVVKAILTLLEKPTQKSSFITFHQLITEYICEIAWKTTEPLNLGNLLPKLKTEMDDSSKSTAWLLEENNDDDHGQNKYSFLTAVENSVNMAWEKWTVVEFFQALNINPESHYKSNLRKDEKYVLKLVDWVNRLNEIRSRLHCTVCSLPLVPNNKYAFDFENYNCIVAFCPHYHDNGISLTHCWNCDSVIDSRENIIKHNDCYLCIHCGCGSKLTNNKILNWVPNQGAVCPKCGSPKMQTDKNNKEVKVCASADCGHQISLRGRVSNKQLEK